MPKGGWRGGGRPIGSESRKPKREVGKQVRWTAAEWEQVEELAEAHNLTPSEYIRRAVLGEKRHNI